MSFDHKEARAIAYRIIIRRRRKCQAAGKHMPVVDDYGNLRACLACGIVS